MSVLYFKAGEILAIGIEERGAEFYRRAADAFPSLTTVLGDLAAYPSSWADSHLLTEALRGITDPKGLLKKAMAFWTSSPRGGVGSRWRRSLGRKRGILRLRPWPKGSGKGKEGSMAVSEKYGKIDIPGIGEDEPVFILRAQDSLALWAIEVYRILCASHGARAQAGLEGVVEAFKRWPGKRKLPD